MINRVLKLFITILDKLDTLNNLQLYFYQKKLGQKLNVDLFECFFPVIFWYLRNTILLTIFGKEPRYFSVKPTRLQRSNPVVLATSIPHPARGRSQVFLRLPKPAAEVEPLGFHNQHPPPSIWRIPTQVFGPHSSGCQ